MKAIIPKNQIKKAYPSFLDMPDFWWALTGSNRRHSACKADALPAELSARMVTGRGIEPLIPPWKGGVLTAWPTGQLDPRVGLEPTTTRLTAECSTDWAIGEGHWRFSTSQVVLYGNFVILSTLFLKFLLIFMFNLNNYFLHFLHSILGTAARPM